MSPTQPAPSNFAQVARRQWWLLAVCVFVAIGGALGYVKLSPVHYQAKRTVSLPVAPNTTSPTGGVLYGPDPSTLASSRSVLKAAAAAAHLGTGAVDLTGSVNATSTTLTLVATQATAAQALAAVNAAAAEDASLERAAVTHLYAGVARQAIAVNQEVQTLTGQLAVRGLPAGKRATLVTQLAVEKAAATQLDTEQVNYQLALGAAAPGSPATQPSGTVARSKSKALEIAAVLGLIVGGALALLREHLSDGITAKEQVSEAGAPPILAEIPNVKGPSRPAAVAADSQSPFAEAFRELRTNLRFLRSEHQLRVLLVTSPSAGEGKSFVAANLAAAAAAAGQRTVLLSTDLRRSTIEGYFHLEATPVTLSDYLIAAARAEREERRQKPLRANARASAPDLDTDLDIDGLFGSPELSTGAMTTRLLAATEIEGLQVIPTGAPPSNPAELLGSRPMAALFDALRERVDLVVIDSPPVLAVTDTLVVSAFVDGVILVVSRPHTSRQAVHDALDRLHRGPAPVVGTVLNRGQSTFANSYLYLSPKD